jgi:predicted dehydrogenase
MRVGSPAASILCCASTPHAPSISIFGGRGGYSGTIIGALILTVLNSILTLLDVPESVRQILYGAIILLLAAAYTRLTVKLTKPIERTTMPEKLRVLVVGLGHMGVTHAKAYDRLDGYELAGFCCRSIARRDDIVKSWPHVARFADYGEALASVKPDVVSINTWPDTHADFAVRTFQAGAHVFLEKPIAETIADAERVVAAAEANSRQLLVGLGPRHSPTWVRFMELARGLGKPLVMRMNLNQRSIGPAWTWHKDLMKSLSPIVDCGVHYVDMMSHMTGAKPVRVHAIGARLAVGDRPLDEPLTPPRLTDSGTPRAGTLPSQIPGS